MNAATVVIERHRAALSRILPFAIYISFLPLPSLFDTALPGFDGRWLYAVQIGSVLLALGWFRRDYIELWEAPCPGFWQWLVALSAGGAVFVLWINLDLPWATIGDGTRAGFDPRRSEGTLDGALVTVRLLGAALVVPVMEELFWRSFLMRWIDRPAFLTVRPAALSLRALLLSSAVFGLEHDLWLAGIVAGLAYGWLYRRSGNLWSPLLAHGATNLILGLWVLHTGNWQFW